MKYTRKEINPKQAMKKLFLVTATNIRTRKVRTYKMLCDPSTVQQLVGCMCGVERFDKFEEIS